MTNDYWMNMALAILLEAVKNKKKAGKYEKGLKKLRDTLNLLFPPGDEAGT